MDAKSSGDNSWTLTSSALLLLMTGPGLALFYGGLVRKKNVLATMMQIFAIGRRCDCMGAGYRRDVWKLCVLRHIDRS